MHRLENRRTLSRTEFLDSSLTLKRVPWAIWSLSFIIFATSTVLLLHLTGNVHVFPGFGQGHWWQFLITTLLYILATTFFLFGKLEIVTFDRDSGLMTLTKWILCYKWKYNNYALADISAVNLLKSGTENVHSNTIHYKLSVYFRYGAKALIAETKNEKEAYQKALKIRKFLEIEGDIELKDHSKV